MFSDRFKNRYTTIPFAIHKKHNEGVFQLYSHYHKEIELITVISGAIDFYVGTELYEVKEGEVLVIPPYCMHRAHMYPGTRHECICFDLSILWDDTLRRDLEKGVLTVRSHLTQDLPYTPFAYKCARSALAAYENKRAGWEMEVIGNLSLLFGRLCAVSFFVKSGIADVNIDFVKSVVEYVKGHYGEQITSRIVAEQLYLNNSYFCRLFKKMFGCCFSEYLTSYRIEQAKILLNTTELSVSEVAFKCGFNGFSYFSKVFKESAGISPSKYRAACDTAQNPF